MPDGDGELTKEEISQLRVGVLKYIDTRFAASEKAVDKALDSINGRLATTNEWRSALDDFVRTLVPKSTYEEKMKSLDKEIEELKHYKDLMDGKASQRSLGSTQLMLYIMSAISVVGFALSIADRLMGK